jgi:hypothetical protein
LLPELRASKTDLLVALAEPRPDPGDVSGHWLISQFAERMERWFSPPVTRAELAERYPGAVLVPLPSASAATQRRLTPAELDELAKLVPLVGEHYGCQPEELAEMRAAAARDPSAALESFRATARELGLEHTEREPERFLTADQWLSLSGAKA